MEDGDEVKRKVDILTKAVMNLSLASQQGPLKEPIVPVDSTEVLRGQHSDGDSRYTAPLPATGKGGMAGGDHETNDADVSLTSDTNMCDTEHNFDVVKRAANINAAEGVGERSAYEENTSHAKRNDVQRK